MIEGQHIGRVGLSRAGRRIHEAGMAFLRANPSEAVAPPVPKYIERAEKDHPATGGPKPSSEANRLRLSRIIPNDVSAILWEVADQHDVDAATMLSKERGMDGKFVLPRIMLIGRIATETNTPNDHIAAIFGRTTHSIRKTVLAYGRRAGVDVPPAKPMPTAGELAADADKARAFIGALAESRGITMETFSNPVKTVALSLIRHEAWWRCATETDIALSIIGRVSDRGHSGILNGIRGHAKRNELPMPRGLAAS